MYGKKLDLYIPEPERVSSDYYIACHYYPGWSDDSYALHGGFKNLMGYPERTPIQGYYDSKDPEVVDWEIKWACEHGINCFIYCWYRYKNNEGMPVTKADIRSGGLHEGFLAARFQNYMDFAIMWECQDRWATVKDKEDLLNNILPFWVETYFSKPNYMSFDNTPYVYVFAPNNLIKAFGGVNECKEALEACSEEAKKYGFNGIHFSCEQYRPNLEELELLQNAGFQSSFQYGWFPDKVDIPKEEYENYLKTVRFPSKPVMDFEIAWIKERIEKFPGYCMFTNSVARNSTPTWLATFRRTKVSTTDLQWEFTPSEYRESLEKIKELIDELPIDDIGRKIVVLDNWNEWGEGHFIAPCIKNGYKYLQAVREVYTKRDNLPDYRDPGTLEFGPYDQFYMDK